MSIALSLVLLTLSLLVGVAAVGGETWRPVEGAWHRRLTTRGWVTVICLALTVAVGFAKDVVADRESAALTNSLDAAHADAERLSSKLESARAQLEAVNRETAAETRDDVLAAFEVLPQALVLSPEWSAIMRVPVTNFAASRLVLTGFNCDVRARITIAWNPDDLMDSDATESSIRTLRGEPKVLSIGSASPEVREFVGAEVLDEIPPPLWGVGVRIELSAARTCAGVYWVDNAHAFDEMLAFER